MELGLGVWAVWAVWTRGFEKLKILAWEFGHTNKLQVISKLFEDLKKQSTTFSLKPEGFLWCLILGCCNELNFRSDGMRSN